MEQSFDPEVEACLKDAYDNLYLVHTNDYLLYKPYCEKLFNYAASEQSDYLFALAYYYMMEYYATDNDHVNTISCALEGIKYQHKVKEYELEARSYNILGIYTESMGDASKAVDYLLCAIDCCNDHQCDHVHGMAATNLANLFLSNANYTRALYYYAEAEKYCSRDDADISDSIALLCNKGHCLLSIHRLEDANRCGRQIMDALQIVRAQGGSYLRFTTHVYLATLAHANGDMPLMHEHIALAQQDFHASDNYTNYLEDIAAYIRLYADLERYDDVIEILEYFLKKCEDDHAPFYVYSIFLEQRIECALLLHDDEAYLHYSKYFIRQYQENRTRNSDAVLRAENSHKEQRRIAGQQREMVKRNAELTIASQHDTLTGLPNRAYMNSHAEETLARATKKQVSFGIEILDIDYFKQINDRYGHLEGDRYLMSVAELLLRMSEEDKDIFAARYGGDEFVIVYYDKTPEQITTCMNRLKAASASLLLPAPSEVGVPYVSLSQGCCCAVPKEVNRLWDFLSRADNALYEAKNAGKNGYRLMD